EGEGIGETLPRLDRAELRRGAPPAQALARALLDAEAIVIGLAEQDHRLDIAKLGRRDKRCGRRAVVLRINDADALKPRLDAVTGGTAVGNRLLDRRLDLGIGHAARTAAGLEG